MTLPPDNPITALQEEIRWADRDVASIRGGAGGLAVAGLFVLCLVAANPSSCGYHPTTYSGPLSTDGEIVVLLAVLVTSLAALAICGAAVAATCYRQIRRFRVRCLLA